LLLIEHFLHDEFEATTSHYLFPPERNWLLTCR